MRLKLKVKNRYYFPTNLIYSFTEYHKILSKKSLIMSKSNIYFNVIFLIEELNLRLQISKRNEIYMK